jgi:protocatechuate 3,4-dioxygenase, alpha subunit
MSDPPRPIATSSQTVGPFFHFGLATSAALGRIAEPDVPGEHIDLQVCVLDGAGVPVPDALIEVYQADADGRYRQETGGQGAFSGFGRLPTGADGCCRFQTVKPGVVRTADAAQAPHVDLCLLSRGLLRQIYTRIYFRGDLELPGDPILELVPADRRDTLLAEPVATEPATWRFVIRLQGDRETVFFDL